MHIIYWIAVACGRLSSSTYKTRMQYYQPQIPYFRAFQAIKTLIKIIANRILLIIAMGHF